MAGQFIVMTEKREMPDDFDTVWPVGIANKVMSKNLGLDEMATVTNILEHDLFYSVCL